VGVVGLRPPLHFLHHGGGRPDFFSGGGYHDPGFGEFEGFHHGGGGGGRCAVGLDEDGDSQGPDTFGVGPQKHVFFHFAPALPGGNPDLAAYHFVWPRPSDRETSRRELERVYVGDGGGNFRSLTVEEPFGDCVGDG